MFESLGFENATPQQVSVWFAYAIGLAFGALAQITRFCFRRFIAGDDRRAAGAVWLTALATALIGTQYATAQGLISFDDHRFMAADIPVLAIVAGGLMFGAGMILSRGCVSRLTVLAGSGNLRAVAVLVAFAIAAHATLKGVLAPVRTTLATPTVTFENPALPGGAILWTALVLIAAAAFAWRSRISATTLALSALLGLLVPLAWVGTGYILLDEFDPIAMESLSFTAPASEALFFTIASTSIPAGFGTGLIAGVLVGAFFSSLARREFKWESLQSPRQTGRYMTGAGLMGVGGVLAGGCTVGAGLAGVPTLSIAAALAIVSIAAGGLITRVFLSASASESGAASTIRPLQPAE